MEGKRRGRESERRMGRVAYVLSQERAAIWWVLDSYSVAEEWPS